MIFGASRPRRARSARTRSTPDATSREDLPPKLIPSIRLLFSTAMSLVHTRIALAGVELEEEVQRLIGAAALAFVALILVVMALIVGTFTIVLAVAPEYRVMTMLGITVLYVVIALILVMRLKGIFSNRPPIFGATLAEIEKDKETLSQMIQAHEAEEASREREAKEERARARGDGAFAPVVSGTRRTTSEGVL